MSYVGARDGIPVPTKPYERAGRAEWVVCGCGHKGRPGGWHVCIDLSTPEPEDDQALTPKLARATQREQDAAQMYAQGAPLATIASALDMTESGLQKMLTRLGVERRTKGGYRKSTKPKRQVEKPPCGTIEGYNWHRRQSLKNPGQPWPLPKEDACGCRAAQAESSRLRRLQEKGDAA